MIVAVTGLNQMSVLLEADGHLTTPPGQRRATVVELTQYTHLVQSGDSTPRPHGDHLLRHHKAGSAFEVPPVAGLSPELLF